MVGYAEYPGDVRIRREAESLIRAGYGVDVVCLQQAGKPRRETVDQVRVYRLGVSKYRGTGAISYAISYVRFFLQAALLVSRLHLANHYVVVQFHTLPDFVIFAGLIPRLLGARLILDMHEVTPEFYMTKFKVGPGHPMVRLAKFIEKASVRFADGIIVVTDPIERIVTRRCKPRCPIVVVMNTADERRIAPSREPPTGNQEGFVAMYHGTLTPMYGLEVAIRAMKILKGKIRGLEFRIFGDNAEARYLKDIAVQMGVDDIVRFMGRVPQDEIPGYIQQAQVGVLPTLRDTFIDLSFSNKLAEYVLMRRPVVATRLNSTLEYFPDGSIAYFESGNAEDLAAKLLHLYENPEEGVRQAALAFENYQRIRWPVMERRYLDLIAGLEDR